MIQAHCFKTVNIEASFISIPLCSMFGMKKSVQCSNLFGITLKRFMSTGRNIAGLFHIKMSTYFFM